MIEVDYRRECEEIEVHKNRLKTVWIASIRSAHYVLIFLQTARSLSQRYVISLDSRVHVKVVSLYPWP